MTEAAVSRIERSFGVVSPQLDRITNRFYEILFAARPETRRLFKGDLHRQEQHLSAALALMVRNVRVLDALEHPIGELGAAHARLGVLPQHYPAVHDAMLAALAEVAGAAWTPELHADWSALLQRISRHMLAGAASSIGRVV